MTSSNPTDEAATDAADWLAVRYVLGELPATEAASYVARLAEDQSAREAVARAATLVETLAVVPQPVATPSRRLPRGRIAAVAATLAAAVLVGLALRPGGDESARPPRIAADEVDPARLIVLWSDAADAPNANPVSDEYGDADPDAALVPPDWLLAAVEQEAMPSPGETDPSLDAESDEI